MTPEEFNVCEMLFTIIDSELIENIHSTFIYNTCTCEQKCYIDWLLIRWIHIRIDKTHMPQKVNHKQLKTNLILNYGV